MDTKNSAKIRVLIVVGTAVAAVLLLVIYCLDYYAKRGYAYSANTIINTKCVYIQDSLNYGNALLVTDNDEKFPLRLYDYNFDRILSFDKADSIGRYYTFINEPAYFSVELLYDDCLMKQILHYTDYIWTPNPLYSIALRPVYLRDSPKRQFYGRDYWLIRMTKAFYVRRFANKWYRAYPFGRKIEAYTRKYYHEQDSLLAYRIKNQPGISYLFLHDKYDYLFGKVTQYPTIYTGKQTDEEVLFYTDRGALSKICKPQKITGPSRLYEIEPGRFIEWIGPDLPAIDNGEFVKEIKIAIEEANHHIFGLVQ